jgi:predicted Zn-dependent protease
MRRIAYAALLLASCATMPPVPTAPAWNEVSGTEIAIEADERILWDTSREERAKLADEGLIVSDAALSAYLNALLTSLIAAPLPTPVPQPEAYVMRSSVRIAGSFPDGGIFITTSMLAAMQNEAQLAALLGHELGHFMGRHRLVQERFAKVSRSTVERMQLSRSHELYADRYAVAAMQRAGYDPRELPRMLQLGEPDEEGARWTEPFRSHPFTHERVRDLQRDIAVAPGETLRVGTEPYEHAIAGVLSVAAEVELQARALDRAHTSITRLLALRPNSGRAYYLKGEHARLTEREGRQSAPARHAYERAVELAPDDPQAVRALGFLYQGDGNAARAKPLLEKYLTLAPDASDRKLIERYIGRDGL